MAAACVLVIGVLVYLELVVVIVELTTGTADLPVEPVSRLS